MSQIGAFAINTFREAMRNKILYTILIFACALIFSAWGVGQLSLHEELRVSRDLGLSGIAFFGVVLSIVGGVNLVYQEIEHKTVYALLSKPVERWQFIVGKYVGLALTLAVQMGLMSVVLAITLAVQGATFDDVLLRATLLLYVQVLVVTSVAVLFSSFSTPLLSGLYAFGVTLSGLFMPELHAAIAAKLKDSPQAARVLIGATHVLPDLHLFFVSGGTVDGAAVSVHGHYVGWGYVGSAGAYGLLYSACVLVIAAVVFSRRDFV